MGSIKATNKEVDANVVKVIETFETFIASKKKAQCAAVIAPVVRYMSAFLGDVRIVLLVITKKARRPKSAIVMRHQTMLMDGIEISFPKIPVKPQRKITPCRLI